MVLVIAETYVLSSLMWLLTERDGFFYLSLACVAALVFGGL